MKNNREVLNQAIETYGAEAQLNVAIEEFSELIKEICKHKRYMDNTKAIIEEMADCYIMLEQMKMIFGLGSTVITDAMDKKIKRLKSRLIDCKIEKVGERDCVNDTSTADVAEVVRCSNCAVPHNRWTGCPKLNGLVTPPDFYCSYGERRKEDDVVYKRR